RELQRDELGVELVDVEPEPLAAAQERRDMVALRRPHRAARLVERDGHAVAAEQLDERPRRGARAEVHDRPGPVDDHRAEAGHDTTPIWRSTSPAVATSAALSSSDRRPMCPMRKQSVRLTLPG